MERMFEVGQLDPTVAALGAWSDDTRVCPAFFDRYWCTWPTPHPGVPHVAGTGQVIVAVWEDEAP